MPNIEMLAFPMSMDCSGTSGALVRMAGFSTGGNSTLVYFSCEDWAVGDARIVPSGGQVERAKMPIGEYGLIVLAQDTEGNMIGLHSLK